MELACEIVDGLNAGELTTDGPIIEIITYEEAMERELEYRKGKDLSSLHPPIASGRLCAPFQELAPHPSPTGTKRKEIGVSLPEPVPKPVNDQRMPPRMLDDRLVHQQSPVPAQFIHQQPNSVQPLQLLQFGQTKPSLEQSNSRQQQLEQQRFGQQLSMSHSQMTLRPGQQYQHQRPPRPQLSVNQQNPQQNSRFHFQRSPFWCGVCKIDCGSPVNFKSHRLGRKHKNNMEERRQKNRTGEMVPSKNNSSGPMINENMIFWCEDCKVRCTDEMNLADHFAGKKHAAVVQGSQANGSTHSLWRV